MLIWDSVLPSLESIPSVIFAAWRPIIRVLAMKHVHEAKPESHVMHVMGAVSVFGQQMFVRGHFISQEEVIIITNT